MMRKQKKNSFFRLSGILVLVLMLALSLVACSTPEADDTDDDSSTTTETVLPIQNGNFEYTTGTSYPKTPKNWTFNTGYTLGSNDSVHVYNGIINVTDDGYTLNSEKYHISSNPSEQGTDGYVLMINNVQYYSASYTSSAITLAKGKYYEISVYVKTALASDCESGAYISVINDSDSRTFSSYEKVSAADWTKYSFIIESNKSTDTSVKLLLSLGNGGKTSANLAKGAAFFDSATITEKTKADYDSAVESGSVNTYTFALRNASFTETSTATSKDRPVVPRDWTSYQGRDENGDSLAPTLGLTRGVINTTTYTPSVGVLKDESIKITSSPNAKDDNVLMIYLSNAESPSSYSYYSSAITFEYDKIYKLSFSVRTAGIKDVNGEATSTKGVTVKLGTETVLFENINTNGNWVEYSAYIHGSYTQSKKESLYFWLGQGHAEDKENFVSGAAFFDNVTLDEIEKDAYTAADETTDTVSKLDMTTPNIIKDADLFGSANNWSGAYAENHGNASSEAVIKAIDLKDYASSGLTAKDPGMATVTREDNNKAIALYNKTANAYSITYTGEIDVNTNKSYRLSFWVKTDSLTKGKGASFTLLNKKDDSTISTISSVNTQIFDEDGKETDTNEWTEIVFYIQGNQLSDNKVTLKASLGSGNMYNPDYLSGTLFMSNMYLETVSYKDYNAVSTSTYVAKHSFRGTASASITNGNFNNIDIDKHTLNASGNPIEKDENDNEILVPGSVMNWTSAYTDGYDKEEVISGIINRDVYATLDSTPATSPFFENGDANVMNGAPNLLMIYNKGKTSYGYTSPTTSLTASTNYKISVNVKSTAGAVVTLTSSGTKTTFDSIDTTEVTENNGWVTYTFYVRVGLNSSTFKLYLGLNTAEDGIAFFDNASFESVSTDDYNAVEEGDFVKKINLNTESFTTTASEFPAAPTNYTGSFIGSAPSSDDAVISGILNVDSYDLELQEKFGLLASTIAPKSGKDALIIFNKIDTAYGYTSNSYSLKANGFYKISVWARTMALADGDKAKIKLALADTANAVFYLSDTEWTEYSFYVKMDDSSLSSVTLALSLGEYNLDDDNKAITADYAKGYAFFDEITIEDITEDAYEAGIANITETTTNIKKIDVVAVNEDDDDHDHDHDDELSEGDTLSVGEIIAIVSASLLSVALVAVLIAVFVKKIAPRMKEKKNKKYKKPTYDKRSSNVATKDDLNKFKD